MVSLMVPNAENNSKRLEFFKSIFSFFAFEEKIVGLYFPFKKKETCFGFHWMKFPSQNAEKSNVRSLQSKKGVLGILYIFDNLQANHLLIILFCNVFRHQWFPDNIPFAK